MTSVLGLILAGGTASRFGGGDKSLQVFQGRPILEHIQERLAPQTDELVLSANGDPSRFSAFQVRVLPDLTSHQGIGPLAGLLSGLSFAQDHVFDFLLMVPCDAPLFPLDLAADLLGVLASHDCARVECDGVPHPVFSLWRTTCLSRIHEAATNGTRALWRVQEALSTVTLSYHAAPYDPFVDADTPDELVTLERLCTPEKKVRS